MKNRRETRTYIFLEYHIFNLKPLPCGPYLTTLGTMGPIEIEIAGPYVDSHRYSILLPLTPSEFSLTFFFI
jgi:hypothetical protein